MPTCLLCKKDVTSGYVVCGGCAGSMKPGTMQPVLHGFASWLGTNLAQDYTSPACHVCEFAKTDVCLDLSRCRKGIAAWFRTKADKFMENPGYER